jgi:Domain of unknown function (DUF4287)
MTESKHLKRRVRERMTKTGERYAAARAQVVAKAGPADREPEPEPPADRDAPPATSPDAVLAATGRELRDWYALLDEHEATGWSHTEMARWLREEHGVAGWWAQSVTVSYERARGLREVHQTSRGFEANVSRTIAVPAPELFEALHARLSAEAVGVRTATPPRSARYDLPEGRMHLVVAPKDEARATAYLVHHKLDDAAAVARHKARWRAWLGEVKAELEG